MKTLFYTFYAKISELFGLIKSQCIFDFLRQSMFKDAYIFFFLKSW